VFSRLHHCPRPTLRVIYIALTQKLVLILLVLALPWMFPTFFAGSLNLRFTRWDIQAYLDIASHGYEAGALRCAFYPLWPAIIRIGSWIFFGSTTVSAWVLANFFSLIFLYSFHRWVSEHHGSRVATYAALLLLFYPGSLFLFVPYSEPLFLLLVMGCLFSLRRGGFWGAVISSFLLPLTRAVGIFILPVIAWELLRARAHARRYVICIAPVLGYLCFLGAMFLYTGNPFEAFTMQAAYPAQPSISRIWDFTGFMRSFTQFVWTHDALRSFIDRGVFIAFALSLYWIIRLDTTYYIYALLTGLIPAMSNILMSYTRFSVVVFPLFIVWASAVTKYRTLLLFLIMLFYSLQIIFLLLFVSGRWAG